MSHVVLQPHSITNPHDDYAIVEYDEWEQYAYGRSRVLHVTDRAPTAKLADDKARELNQPFHAPGTLRQGPQAQPKPKQGPQEIPPPQGPQRQPGSQ